MTSICMICGKEVKESQDYYTIDTKDGDIINAIHCKCYDNDDRDYFKFKK